MSRPRVEASSTFEPIRLRSLGGGLDHTQPGVTVEVSFDLHDHEAALLALDAAVASVKAQIEETRR